MAPTEGDSTGIDIKGTTHTYIVNTYAGIIDCKISVVPPKKKINLHTNKFAKRAAMKSKW